METSLKPRFAQIFSCCPKNPSCPKFGGAEAPLAPPVRTPMIFFVLRPRPLKFSNGPSLSKPEVEKTGCV